MTNPNQQVSILLVEDDDVDAKGIERALRKMQLSNPLSRARDGIEALEILRSDAIKKPRVVLLDINMPRMGGLEVLKELRADPALRDTIVFVLTTSSREDEINEAYQNNIAGYIVKTSLSHDFNQLLIFLDQYWTLVKLPA